MSLTKAQLFDKKGKIHNEMQDALRDVKKRDGILNTEERTKFAAWDNDLLAVQDQLDVLERAEKLDLVIAANAGVRYESNENTGKRYNDAATRVERREALAKGAKYGYSALSDSERTAVDTEVRDLKIFENFLRGRELNADESRIMDGYREKRAQTKGTTTQGGFTVPEGFQSRIVEYMVAVSELMQWADIVRTDTGIDIPMSLNDDSSNTGELIAESGDISTNAADLVFSSYTMKAYKMSSKLIKVSNELLQDNGVNLTDYIAKKLAARVGKISNSYYTTGTGTAQPKGFLQTLGKTTGVIGAFTAAEMVALQDSIDPAYRSSKKLAWSMHSNFLSEIKQMSLAATTDGQVWVPSFRDGEPDQILGKPYFINQAMASTSLTTDKVLAYGDWDKFKIRIVNDFTLKVLGERYAEFDQLAFFGLSRTDSFLEDTTAVKFMAIL